MNSARATEVATTAIHSKSKSKKRPIVEAKRQITTDDAFDLKCIQPDSDSGHGPTPSSSNASQASDNDDQQHDDCFVDASDAPLDGQSANGFGHQHDEDGQQTRAQSQPFDENVAEATRELKHRLEETTQVLRMALSNEFVKALEICSKSADRELYASLANATLSFLKAALTLEQADLQAALSAINLSFEVSSQRRRKQSTASMVMRFLYRPNYNLYTDDQIHAELVHAESLLLLALISFLADQSIICLVKGAFRIRACYQRYKECLYIMENRTQWASQEAQCHFESGVRMGHGIFNLLMSYLPRRVLRFLEYVGFSGNRSIGIDELDRSVELSDGLRSVFSALVILTYHSYVENLFGLGDYDELKVEQLNKTFLGHYPNSAFFLLFLGRYHQMRGQHAEAIASFQRCIEAQNDWKQFHSVCHWEIMWCHASQMDWRQAAHYSDLLRKQSKWSPASYTYQYATFLYAQLVEDQRAGLYDDKSEQFQAKLAEIHEIMLQVPKLRIRYAGKTIPAEKFAITRSVRFCEQSDRLTLPALEFLYIWNQFPTLRNAPRQLERLMQRIDSEIDHLQRTIAKEEARDEDQADEEEEQQEESKPSFVDELSLLYLLKGMCLKHLDRFAEAELCFMEIMEREHDIERDTFLVPHTAMELATLNLSLKQHEQARNWIKLARSNYTGYLLETIVHFRLHAASRLIRLEQMEQELAGASWESANSNGAQGHHLVPDKTKRSAATTSKLTPVN